MIDIRITIDFRDCSTHQFVMPISGTYKEAFEPFAVCDDPIVAFATDDFLEGSKELETKYKLRKDVAKELSEKIADMLIKAMKEKDTYNGYPVIQEKDSEHL